MKQNKRCVKQCTREELRVFFKHSRHVKLVNWCIIYLFTPI